MEPRYFGIFNVLKNKENFRRFRTFVRSFSSVKPQEKPDEKYRLFCFGLTEHGGLGIQQKSNLRPKKFFFKPIRHFFAEENKVTNVAAGYGFTAFSIISKDTFKVYGTGINSDFQLGSHLSPQNVPLDVILKPVPINLGLACPDTKIVALSAGRAHLAILTDKEGVFLSGSNCYGQCARDVLEEDKVTGSLIVNKIEKICDEEIADVLCGQDHTIFITKSRKVWSCGWGCDGQTGLGHTNATTSPAKLEGDIKGENIIKIAGKSDTVLALNDKGEVFGWGSNEYSQLSDGKDLQQINTPRKMDSLNGLGKIVDIAAGGSFCMALNECGDVFVWGYGILGGGPELQRTSKPFLIPRTLFGLSEYQPQVRVCKVHCGLSHLAAVNNYGHLYTWGRNRDGCLGIGHLRDQYFPYKVAVSGLAEKISCGVDHTMVLCKDF